MNQAITPTRSGVISGALGAMIGVLLTGSVYTLLEFTAPAPSQARRVRVIDTTDAETKAYCAANPDRCTTSINWGTTVGAFLIMLLIPIGWRFTTTFLSQFATPGPGDEGYIRPADRT